MARDGTDREDQEILQSISLDWATNTQKSLKENSDFGSTHPAKIWPPEKHVENKGLHVLKQDPIRSYK